MKTALFPIASSLHKETSYSAADDPFIQSIEAACGSKFHICNTLEEYLQADDRVVYVRTGGTEGVFKSLGLTGEVRLLTSGESNSLAASMEILAFLRGQGQQGRILHGTPVAIASALESESCGNIDLNTSPFVRPFAKVDLGGMRLGVIGRPSDWLISSGVDYAKARERMGVELVDIPIEELTAIVRARVRAGLGSGATEAALGTDATEAALRSFVGSEAVEAALREIVSHYGLNGLTLRCFDLLSEVGNTGCLALARLNADGIPSSCEGDIPALLSMAWLQKMRGCPGFQCNLSRISGDELLFAHCTVPLSMVESYGYMTHFESGIGTAIKGELPTGDVEIIKIAPDLERFVCIPGRLVRNESLPNLCRTQIVISAPGASDYFLREPLANHHIVIPRRHYRSL